jgi:hypothetical protein
MVDDLDAAAGRGTPQPYTAAALIDYYKAQLRERAPVVVLRDVQARHAAWRRHRLLPLL